MVITAVIPTKNRNADLLAAIKSILNQTRKPDQLVIVDQSSSTISRDAVSAKMKEYPDVELTYVYDPSIQGLVAAKAESLRFSHGDIVCFLEDDVILEPEYLESIETGFICNDQMLGCSGVVTNPPKIGRFYLFAHSLFHRGIFRDRRPAIYAQIDSESVELIESNALSGGLSAWRKEVFDQVAFDAKNGFHMLEDFEFSRRAAVILGRHFYINPKARLEHNFSPINRDVLDIKQQRKLTEFLSFYKKNCSEPHAFTDLVWLLVGLFVDAVLQSLRCRTLLPFIGTMKGVVFGVRKPVV